MQPLPNHTLILHHTTTELHCSMQPQVPEAKSSALALGAGHTRLKHRLFCMAITELCRTPTKDIDANFCSKSCWECRLSCSSGSVLGVGHVQ